MLIWNYLPVPTAYTIPGFHGEVAADSPKVAMASKYLWGLNGSVVIVGKQSTRKLSCSIWLNDPSWESARDFYIGIANLESVIGTYGDLVVAEDTNNGVWDIANPQRFTNAVFTGFELLTFNGQDVWGPVRDEAGCLYSSSIVPGDRNNKTWAANMRMNWLQTLPGRLVT